MIFKTLIVSFTFKSYSKNILGKLWIEYPTDSKKTCILSNRTRNFQCRFKTELFWWLQIWQSKTNKISKRKGTSKTYSLSQLCWPSWWEEEWTFLLPSCVQFTAEMLRNGIPAQNQWNYSWKQREISPFELQPTSIRITLILKLDRILFSFF